jgi:hypothetical protein
MHSKASLGWRLPAGLAVGVLFWSAVSYMGVHPLFG